MPFLRQELDSTLAETLGRLGQSLGDALNPLNSLRAYDIQQQLFLRRQQLEQLQRENAAKQGAIQQWGHIVPAEKLPQIAAMIYQGAPYDQMARAAAQLSGNLVDDPSPAGLQKNIRYIEQLTGKPYDYAGQGPPVAGVNTAKAFNDWKTQQAGAVSAATEGGKISATRGANAPLVSQYVDQDTPEANANNTRVYMILHNGDLPPNGMPPGIGPNTIAGNNKRAAIAENEKARASAAGTASGAGVDVNQPKLFPQQPPGVYDYGGANGSAQPTPPYPPSPLTLSPAQPTPSVQPQALTVQNPAAPYSAPTAIVRPVKSGGTLTGQAQGETTAGTQLAEDNRKLLMGAVDEGASAIQMKNKIAQLRDLSSIVSAGGVGGQVTTAIMKRLADNGLVISNAGEPTRRWIRSSTPKSPICAERPAFSALRGLRSRQSGNRSVRRICPPTSSTTSSPTKKPTPTFRSRGGPTPRKRSAGATPP